MTNNKALANIALNTGESVVLQATDQETGATAQVTLTVDWVMAAEQPPEPGPEPAEGAAKWLAPSEATASTLETGDIIQLTAWGGDEYGYAYTYALLGAPAGVVIDADLGRLSIGTALAKGNYGFLVVVTNREDKTKTVDLPFTLRVVEGITSGTPTASQILHKTFDPHSGNWGKPSSGDWTNVFVDMNKAILDLQATCPEECLRVKIPLRRGQTYKYTKNEWLNSIQYFHVYDTGTGALPVLQNIKPEASSGGDIYGGGPLNIGGAGGGRIQSGALGHQMDGVKSKLAPIATVAAGSTTVTLRESADAAKIKVGRWHQVVGWVIQIGGYPSNCQFIDYVKVAAVNGSTVTLDRPLKYAYDQTWWEMDDPADSNSDISIGMGRLCPFDTGGPGGYIPTDRRIIIRGRLTNLNFISNPTYPNTREGGFWSTGGIIDFTVEGCTLPCAQLGAIKHVYIKGCTATEGWEPDKLTETLTFDGGDNQKQVIGGATGMQYVLFRNHKASGIQLSPRQLRAINTHFNGLTAVEAAAQGAPVTVAYPGPLNFWDFGMAGGCQFTHVQGSTNWTPTYGTGNYNGKFNVGHDGNWDGDRLVIPRSYVHFEPWLVWSYPGAIVSVDPESAPPVTRNWGYVASASSPGDSSALWLDIVWVDGTRPTSGMLWLQRRQRLHFADANTFNDGTTYTSGGFTRETAPGNETSWDYPDGYPPELKA